jgi:hypothetical protein
LVRSVILQAALALMADALRIGPKMPVGNAWPGTEITHGFSMGAA